MSLSFRQRHVARRPSPARGPARRLPGVIPEKLTVGLCPWKVPFPPAGRRSTSRVVDLVRRVLGRGPSSVDVGFRPAPTSPTSSSSDRRCDARAPPDREVLRGLRRRPRALAPLAPPRVRPCPRATDRRLRCRSVAVTTTASTGRSRCRSTTKRSSSVLTKFPDATLVFFGDDAAFVELAIARYGDSRAPSTPSTSAVIRSRSSRWMAACDHCIISNSVVRVVGCVGRHRRTSGE